MLLTRLSQDFVGWAKAPLRRAHHLSSNGTEVVGTLPLCPPYDACERISTSPHIRNNACRSIFPVPVFGSSSIKITSRGYL
ncbi:hypothetical protein ABID59_006525 [Bradyrhizobium sp. S3.3.6]